MAIWWLKPDLTVNSTVWEKNAENLEYLMIVLRLYLWGDMQPWGRSLVTAGLNKESIHILYPRLYFTSAGQGQLFVIIELRRK